MAIQPTPANQQPQEQTPFYKGDSFRDIAGDLAIAFNSMRLNPDPSVVQNIQAIKSSRTEEQARNKTFEYLAKAGRSDLAEAIQSGALDPRTAVAQMFQDAAEERKYKRSQAAAGAKSAASAQQAQNIAKYLADKGRPDLAEMIIASPDLAGSIMGEMAKSAIKPEGAGYTKDQISLMGSLRDDLRKDVGEYNLISQGYDRILQFYNNPNAVSDYALAVSFAKILDPGSVAREGEVAAVQNAGARVPALGQALKNAITGEGALTPEVRQQIAEASRNQYASVVPKAQQQIEAYKAIAQKGGLTLQDIYTGPEFKEPQAVVPSIIPQSAIDANLDQQDWNEMSLEDKKAFM